MRTSRIAVFDPVAAGSLRPEGMRPERPTGGPPRARPRPRAPKGRSALNRMCRARAGAGPPQTIPTMRYEIRPGTEPIVSTRTGTAAGSMEAGLKSLARTGPSGRRPSCIRKLVAGAREILMGAARVLAHLLGGGSFVVDEGDLVHPLDRGAAVPAGHDETHRIPVVRAQGSAVHLRGQERARVADLVEAEDPARPRHRARVGGRVLVEARDEHSGWRAGGGPPAPARARAEPRSSGRRS